VPPRCELDEPAFIEVIVLASPVVILTETGFSKRLRANARGRLANDDTN
jgi:hypothetical protein